MDPWNLTWINMDKGHAILQSPTCFRACFFSNFQTWSLMIFGWTVSGSWNGVSLAPKNERTSDRDFLNSLIQGWTPPTMNRTQWHVTMACQGSLVQEVLFRGEVGWCLVGWIMAYHGQSAWTPSLIHAAPNVNHWFPLGNRPKMGTWVRGGSRLVSAMALSHLGIPSILNKPALFICV